MHLPIFMPSLPRKSEQRFGENVPLDGTDEFASAGTLFPQGDWLRCSACCAGKAGFGGCVARCMATDQACDGGLTNCTPCY